MGKWITEDTFRNTLERRQSMALRTIFYPRQWFGKCNVNIAPIIPFCPNASHKIYPQTDRPSTPIRLNTSTQGTLFGRVIDPYPW